ncbi:MAG TPA: ABC transporter permease [Bryobacterales bacterium]|nr:ABC transporter permease [Bryobacterales bacterium]
MELIAQAVQSLKSNTFRSCLTILGIVWGITAVSMLQAYGDGFRRSVVRGFDAFGPDVIMIWPGQTSEQAGGERAGRKIRLEMEDVGRLKEDGTLLKNVSPELLHDGQASNGVRQTSVAVRAVWPAYGEIRNETATGGRFLNEEDLTQRRRAIFLGSEVRRKLFGNMDPVGQSILLNNARFTVVGWMEKKLNFSSYYRADDDSVFIPMTAATDMWETRYPSLIVVDPVNRSASLPAVAQAREILARRQRFSPKDERAVRIFSRAQFRPIIDGITIGIEVLLAVIGVLTLGIGGVGVMNIMLVSVTERTREIGVRMAVGATRRQIRAQFLLEAMAIVGIGGAIGLALSYGIVHAVGVLPLMGEMFQDESGRADIHLQLSWISTLQSVALLAVVGVARGLFPAVKASRLNPIEALRYE